MDQTFSNRDAVVNFEYLEDSDLRNLPFNTPADVERYWTLAAERIKSGFVIEGGSPLVDIDLEDNLPRKIPAEIVQMELASASGNIAAVEAVYHLWRDRTTNELTLNVLQAPSLLQWHTTSYPLHHTS